MLGKIKHVPWNKGLIKDIDRLVRNIAGSKIDRKHSKETEKKISEVVKGKNHPFYSKHLSEETRRKISKTLANKNPENIYKLFTNNQKQILFGSLLGDGSLIKSKINCSFEEIHSIKQRDYLLWKNKHLKIFYSKTVNKLYKNSKSNKIYKQLRLTTSALPILTKYYNLFYQNGKKTISKEILEQLDELGLTIWYLDDGSIRLPENLINISTDSYSYEEHLMILDWLKRNFGVSPKISKRNRNYYLTFNRKDSDFLLLIFKKVFETHHIPKCIWYKLGYLWKGNEGRIKQLRKKRIEYKKKWRKKWSEIKRKEKLSRLQNIAERIKELYWNEGLSLSQVARNMRYSSSYVYKIMKKFNISRRTRSEANSGIRNGFYGKHHSRKSIDKMLKSKGLKV